MPSVERATYAASPNIATLVLASSTEVGVDSAPLISPGQPQAPSMSVAARTAILGDSCVHVPTTTRPSSTRSTTELHWQQTYAAAGSVGVAGESGGSVTVSASRGPVDLAFLEAYDTGDAARLHAAAAPLFPSRVVTVVDVAGRPMVLLTATAVPAPVPSLPPLQELTLVVPAGEDVTVQVTGRFVSLDQLAEVTRSLEVAR